MNLECLRCIVQERYPSSENLDTMQAVFDKYGAVEHIERRIPVFSNVRVGTVCCQQFDKCYSGAGLVPC